MRRIIKNGSVFLSGEGFRRADLMITDGIISEISGELNGDAQVIDATGMLVFPGLVDIHVHGACGCDFSDGDEKSNRIIAEYEASVGVTTICPTTMSMGEEDLIKALKAGKKAMNGNAGKSSRPRARIAGFNLEGPFLALNKKGAQKEEYLRDPDIRFFRELKKASGQNIRLVTLAPELPGAMEFIRSVNRGRSGTRGVTEDDGKKKELIRVSLGHTAADYETCMKCFEMGADHVTHLYNAMSEFGHREPGVIGAAIDGVKIYHRDITAELITDGIHVHDCAIRTAFDLLPGRIALVSDSMRATGLNDGNYYLGGQEVRVIGKRAELFDGTIAGSVSNLYECLIHAVEAGIPMEEAIAAATVVPARSIGIEETAGQIKTGMPADIIIADKTLKRKSRILVSTGNDI